MAGGERFGEAVVLKRTTGARRGGRRSRRSKSQVLGGSVSGTVHLRRRQIVSLCLVCSVSFSFSAALCTSLSLLSFESLEEKASRIVRLRGWLSTKCQRQETVSFQRIAFTRPALISSFVTVLPSYFRLLSTTL